MKGRYLSLGMAALAYISILTTDISEAKSFQDTPTTVEEWNGDREDPTGSLFDVRPPEYTRSNYDPFPEEMHGVWMRQVFIGDHEHEDNNQSHDNFVPNAWEIYDIREDGWLVKEYYPILEEIPIPPKEIFDEESGEGYRKPAIVTFARWESGVWNEDEGINSFSGGSEANMIRISGYLFLNLQENGEYNGIQSFSVPSFHYWEKNENNQIRLSSPMMLSAPGSGERIGDHTDFEDRLYKGMAEVYQNGPATMVKNVPWAMVKQSFLEQK